MAENNEHYDASDIQVLEGLEAVRKRPGMYIGTTDVKGLHHLVWEIVDNAIDESLAGYCNNIEIIINKDNSVTVKDDGRGIPVDIHPKTKISTVETVYTVLHAGGKFGGGGYKVSGGLHGVGASVVNALSKWMKVSICRDGGKYEISFKNGGHLDSDLKKVGTTNKTGTTVRFMPDDTIFSTTTFSFTTICERMQESAFLIKGLMIDVIDEEDEKEAHYHYERGLEEFVSYLNEGKKVLHNVVGFDAVKNKIEVECALQYTDSYSENVVSFVNNVKTSDGGSHEVGLKSALTKVFNDYAKNNGYLKAKDKNFEGTDVREGLTVVLSLKIPEDLLQFEGQTKGKLGTPLAKTVVEQVVYEKMQYFLEENKAVATDIINKALKGKAAREAARKAREEARKGKTKNSKEKNLSDKLAPATKKNPKKNELFIVEGDSAGGSAKTGRERSYQAILPLRGKVLNTERCTMEEAYKNAEINTLIYTIGAGVGSSFHIEDCNYDKIIIMTDADDDGCHIQVLLVTFFYRYMKPLIEAGKVYIANPPLYKISFGKKEEVYAYSDEELKELTKNRKTEDLQRYKGLGEMDANQLWETTMDPLKRSLIQVKITDVALAEKRVSILMGDKVEPRKEWIEENVDFTLEDSYEMLR